MSVARILPGVVLVLCGLVRAEDPVKPASPPKAVQSTADLPRIPTPAGEAATERPTRPPGTEPALEQVSQWIEDLKSLDFRVREQATDELMKAGSVAVPGLLELAQTARLEPAIRAVRILRKLYTAGTREDFEAAADALEELVTAGNGIAQRAELALSTRAVERQQRVISRIEALGGEVRLSTRNTSAIVIGNQILQDNVPQVEQMLLGDDWKGGDLGLKLVRRLQPTVHITIYVTPDCGISQNALDALMSERPDIEVEPRGSAMLGISCETLDGQLIVQRIQEGSGARMAELEVNDIITKFEGQEITDFRVIIDSVRSRKVGEKVTLDVFREGKTFTKEIILGKWTLKDQKP